MPYKKLVKANSEKKHSMYKTYHNIIQQQSDGAVLAWTWTLF